MYPDTELDPYDLLDFDAACLLDHSLPGLSVEWLFSVLLGVLGHEYISSIWCCPIPSAECSFTQLEPSAKATDFPIGKSDAKASEIKTLGDELQGGMVTNESIA